jgi:hypothetical protein
MNERETMRAALAECAAIAGQWCRLVDGALGDPDRLQKLAEVTPRVLAGIMTAAADALEASGYDVEAEIDYAVERIKDSHGMIWN